MLAFWCTPAATLTLCTVAMHPLALCAPLLRSITVSECEGQPLVDYQEEVVIAYAPRRRTLAWYMAMAPVRFPDYHELLLPFAVMSLRRVLVALCYLWEAHRVIHRSVVLSVHTSLYGVVGSVFGETGLATTAWMSARCRGAVPWPVLGTPQCHHCLSDFPARTHALVACLLAGLWLDCWWLAGCSLVAFDFNQLALP